MTNRFGCLVLGLALAGSVHASGEATMTEGAYDASEEKIESKYKADSKACDAMRNYDRHICEAVAGGKEKVTKAELDAKNKPGAGAEAKVKRAQADAAYDIARQKCSDLRGDRRRECRKDAKVVYDRTKSQARFDKMRAAEAARRAASSDYSSPSPRK